MRKRGKMKRQKKTNIKINIILGFFFYKHLLYNIYIYLLFYSYIAIDVISKIFKYLLLSFSGIKSYVLTQ